jgi:hypothetical protein
MLDELQVAWTAVSGAVSRGEHISGPAARNLTDLLLHPFERSYARFARALKAGDSREEVLANIARHFSELWVYFADLERVLTDCASRLDYAAKAAFVSERYRVLITPVLSFALAAEGARGPALSAMLRRPPAGADASLSSLRVQVTVEHSLIAVAWGLVSGYHCPAGLPAGAGVCPAGAGGDAAVTRRRVAVLSAPSAVVCRRLRLLTAASKTTKMVI